MRSLSIRTAVLSLFSQRASRSSSLRRVLRTSLRAASPARMRRREVTLEAAAEVAGVSISS